MGKNAGELKGSELDGAEEDLAAWVGLDIPEEKSDAYADLVGGVRALGAFFETVEHGTFEVTEEEEGGAPGQSDTFWVISYDDADALREELRERLVRELGLEVAPPAVGVAAPAKARRKRAPGAVVRRSAGRKKK